MGRRIRSLILLLVLVGVGVLLGSSLAQWWGPESAPLALPSFVRPEGRVRVEVLNGGGKMGVARDATTVLRDRGFDVVFFGNAESFSADSSVVMDRVGKLGAARIVADALGIREVRTLPDSNLYVDVTVRLGPEWSLSGPSVSGGEAKRPWWDLRGLFRRPGAPGSQ